MGEYHALPPAAPPLAGIQTNDRFSVNTLIQDIFVGGACKNVSNIHGIGDKKGIGYFENGRDIIGIERGILLATGPIGNAAGPNSIGDESGDFKDETGDADLRRMTAAKIFDAVGVEFDFVPLDSIVTFRYVFASEEYCEFVGTSFNDVFGFFVSGPGISGPFTNNSVNIALIPGSNDYVSINNVNHRSNTSYFIRNEPRRDAERCGIEWKETPNLGLIEYDGFTKVLTATLRLYPCQTYHMRLVIGDASDGNYDSAVFLEAESFNIGGNIRLAAGGGASQDTLKEGCDDGFFLARRREGEKTDMPLTIGLKVSAASTATPGVDFAPLPSSVTIPPGATETRIPIDLMIDGVDEQLETIILELDFPCACISGTASIYIEDPPPLRTALGDQLICVGDSIRLNPGTGGGVPPYHYLWSSGETTETIRVTPTVDTTYSITVTDACGRIVKDRFRLTRRKPPQVRLNLKKEVCFGDSIQIPIFFEGNAPYRFRYSINAQDKGVIAGITNNPYLLTVKEEGLIKITEYSDAICTGEVFGEAEIRYYRLQTIVNSSSVTCDGLMDGKIETQVSGGIGPYRFFWEGRGEAPGSLSNLPPGAYNLTIQDANGCSIQITQTITEPPVLEPVTFDCRDLRGRLLLLSAKGGAPPYAYSIDGQHFKNESIFQELIPGETYRLTVRDALGCQLQQNLTMPARYERMVELDPSVKLELGERYTMEPRINIPLSLVSSFEWTPPEPLSCADCLRPMLIGLDNQTFVLKVTDIFGCSDGASIIVKIDGQVKVFIPNAFSPDGDGYNDRLTVFANSQQVTQVKKLQIFNRWGLMVFEAHDFPPNSELNGWDGRHRGTLMETGVYVYLAEVELVDGRHISLKGSVSMVH